MAVTSSSAGLTQKCICRSPHQTAQPARAMYATESVALLSAVISRTSGGVKGIGSGEVRLWIPRPWTRRRWYGGGGGGANLVVRGPAPDPSLVAAAMPTDTNASAVPCWTWLLVAGPERALPWSPRATRERWCAVGAAARDILLAIDRTSAAAAMTDHYN